MLPPELFHGTSTRALELIRAGDGEALLIFQAEDDNASLGGAYMSSRFVRAQTYAMLAAHIHGGDPVVLRVVPGVLFPDEDWVNPVAEGLDEAQTAAAGLTAFMADLFTGYNVHDSLSTHYKARYAELNARHGITAQHSLHWIECARQESLLLAGQILEVLPGSLPPSAWSEIPRVPAWIAPTIAGPDANPPVR
jgi:hypothetical protein